MGWWLSLLLLGTLSLPATPPPAMLDEPPTLTAGQAVVLAEPGPVILYERAADDRLPPASLTKLMTAHVALQRGHLDQRLTVVSADLVGQASMGLRVGQSVSLETLLYGLLLPSGNDAAMTIARGLGAGDGLTEAAAVERFVGWMNDEALRLDLDDTHFVNPHGLDAPGHYASAYDLARLALIAWQEPRLARLLGTSAVVSDGFRLQHGHALIGRYPGVLGGKTGRTRGCRSCLLTIAERDGRRVAIVLLRATREQIVAETTTLLDWSFRQPLPSPRPRPASGERSPACWRPVWRGLCAGLMPLGL